MEPSDNELVAKYLGGDGQSLEVLIDRHLVSVYAFLYRLVGNAEEAEDIIQEVFLRVWQNLKRFDPEKNFKTWLFSIARNAAIDFLRKKKSLTFSEFENPEGGNVLEDTLIDPAPLASELLLRADLGRELEYALAKLSPQYRETLLLYYESHLTFREIAETLGEPLDTVKSRHRRALILLRRFLDRGKEDDGSTKTPSSRV